MSSNIFNQSSANNFIIIYVTAEELASLKGVEAYRFSLVPVAADDTAESTEGLSPDSRIPVSPDDSTAQTTDISPNSKTSAE
jgi:hypothetical protein